MLLIELNYLGGETSLWEENTGFGLGCGDWIILINLVGIPIPVDYLCDDDKNSRNNNS